MGRVGWGGDEERGERKVTNKGKEEKGRLEDGIGWIVGDGSTKEGRGWQVRGTNMECKGEDQGNGEWWGRERGGKV